MTEIVVGGLENILVEKIKRAKRKDKNIVEEIKKAEVRVLV